MNAGDAVRIKGSRGGVEVAAGNLVGAWKESLDSNNQIRFSVPDLFAA